MYGICETITVQCWKLLWESNVWLEHTFYIYIYLRNALYLYFKTFLCTSMNSSYSQSLFELFCKMLRPFTKHKLEHINMRFC